MEENNNSFSAETGEEPITNANVDPLQASHLSQQLQEYYQPMAEENEQSLERIWKRFVQQQEQTMPGVEKEQIVSIERLRFQRERKLRMKETRADKTKFVARQVSMIAAVILVAALVGSLALVLNLTHKGHGTTTAAGDVAAPGIYIRSINAEKKVLLSKLDSKDRHIVWSSAMVGEFAVRDVVVKGKSVYVKTTNADRSAPNLHAIDAENGKERWSIKVDILRNPTVSAGSVYILAPNGTLRALNEADGSERWKIETVAAKAETGQTGSGQIEAGNGLIYVSLQEGMVAFNASDGSKSWTLPAQNMEVFDKAEVVGETIYTSAIHTDGSDNETSMVYAIAAKSGKKLWEYPLKSSVFNPVVIDQTVYLNRGYQEIIALKASDGTKLWSQPRVMEASYSVKGGLLSGGMYQVSWNSSETSWNIGATNHIVLDEKTGQQVSRITSLDKWKDETSFQDGKAIYARPTPNSLAAFNISDGAESWHIQFGPEVVGEDQGGTSKAQGPTLDIITIVD